MKIFVSGASGFVGRAFCQEALRRGHHILALSREPTAVQQALPEVEVARGSLADTPWDVVSSFAPEAVLHLAWIAEPGVYLGSPENETWLQQSKVWFQRLIDMDVAYLAGAGTCIEYAASSEPLREHDSPLAPQFPYSRAKAALFEWLQAQDSVAWGWFRIFYPYGQGEHPNRFTSIMARQLREGKTLSINTPDSVRDYIEIRDVASAICLAMEARVTGPLNIGTGQGITISHLANGLASLLGAANELVQSNAGAGLDPMPCIVADTARLKQLGWRPSVCLEDGLARLAAANSATL
jgi:dTDP-6-deoxy-L-talose 4-dehydrogenase (NAD+)